MPLETKLILMVAVALACTLAYAVLRVLCVWSEHHITRHDLIVESRRRRSKYFSAVAKRNRHGDHGGNVIIDDDEEDGEEVFAEPAELAQAA